MNKIVKNIDLTKGELKGFIKNLKAVKKEAPKVRRNIISDLRIEAKSEISKSLSTTNYEPSEKTSIFEINTNNGNDTVGISGSQAIYDEFGTGTVGANNPHEIKGDFQLNPYNSGETIRPNSGINSSGTGITRASMEGIPLNGMYWTYKIGERKIYTQGRPAGMHVYKASKRVKRIMNKVIEKRVGDWLSKL